MIPASLTSKLFTAMVLKIRPKQKGASRQSGGDVKFDNTEVCRCTGLALVKGKGIDSFQPGVGRRLFDGVDGADAHGRPDVYTAISYPIHEILRPRRHGGR